MTEQVITQLFKDPQKKTAECREIVRAITGLEISEQQAQEISDEYLRYAEFLNSLGVPLLRVESFAIIAFATWKRLKDKEGILLEDLKACLRRGVEGGKLKISEEVGRMLGQLAQL